MDSAVFRVYTDDASERTPAGLAALGCALDARLRSLCAGHVWQSGRGPALRPWASGAPEPHLRGSLRYADNVDDEWLLAWLLLALTRELPRLSVAVEDADDGQFLLVEAAEHLPRWLDPETSANRVFLRAGALHVVPQPRTPAEVAVLPAGPALGLADALGALRSGAVDTRAPPGVQEAISQRLAMFPAAIEGHKHRARALVPLAVAAVLRQRPALVANAVNAFYYRDPDDACQRMQRFGGSEVVMTLVTLTRCLYAQLTCQPFTPPPSCGPMPHPTDPDHAPALLGAKLACGMEMMYQRARRAASSAAEGGVDERRFEEFSGRLEAMGYYRGEIRGSRLRTQLERSAREYLARASSQPEQSDDGAAGAGDAAAAVDAVLDGSPLPQASEFARLPASADDSEEWMQRDPAEVFARIERSRREMGSGRGAPSVPQSGNDVLEGLSRFVGQVSDFEGAEAAGPAPEAPVDFDPDRVMELLRSAVGTTPGDSDSDSYEDEDNLDFGAEDVDEVTSELQRAMLEEMQAHEGLSRGQPGAGDAVGRPAMLSALLQSAQGQQGEPGPVTSLLGGMASSQ
eukprot:m51a1_g10707 hypothetical protein (573) ;mRNA; f:172532-174749